MMETAFTPLQSLGGGALIGLSAVLLMGLHGRIFGATGILTGLIAPGNRSDFTWRAILLLGMIGGPLLVLLLTGKMPALDVPVSTAALVVGGLLVGVGVTFSSGCTSGHGVCGLARLSPRSAASVATFMAATAATVYVIRHVIGA